MLSDGVRTTRLDGGARREDLGRQRLDEGDGIGRLEEDKGGRRAKLSNMLA